MRETGCSWKPSKVSTIRLSNSAGQSYLFKVKLILYMIVPAIDLLNGPNFDQQLLETVAKTVLTFLSFSTDTSLSQRPIKWVNVAFQHRNTFLDLLQFDDREEHS